MRMGAREVNPRNLCLLNPQIDEEKILPSIEKNIVAGGDRLERHGWIATIGNEGSLPPWPKGIRNRAEIERASDMYGGSISGLLGGMGGSPGSMVPMAGGMFGRMLGHGWMGGL
jgi:hypothetical protein